MTETKNYKQIGLLYAHLLEYENAVIYLCKSGSY